MDNFITTFLAIVIIAGCIWILPDAVEKERQFNEARYQQYLETIQDE